MQIRETIPHTAPRKYVQE